VASTTDRPCPVLEPDFYSFFALRTWYNMDDHGVGQNTAIYGQILGKKTKNPAKHIKQQYPSINLEYESKQQLKAQYSPKNDIQ